MYFATPPSLYLVTNEVVDVVAVGRVLLRTPIPRQRKLAIHSSLRLTLIVDAIKTDDPLQKHMQFRVGVWIFGDFEQRLKDVPDDFFEPLHKTGRFVNIVQPRNLNHSNRAAL